LIFLPCRCSSESCVPSSSSPCATCSLIYLTLNPQGAQILISSLRANKRFLERRILTSSSLFGPWRMWFLDGYWLRFFFQSAAVLLPAWCDGATAACWDDWIYPGANDYSTICWMPRPPCETVRWCLPVLVQSRSPLSSVCTSAPAYFVLAPAWDGSRKLQSSLHLCFLLIVQVMQ